jgi:long-chain-fatty-acid--CoA ligase ACSBG
MADDRVVVMSSQGYKALVNPVDGKGLHWVTDVNSEIPIKVRASGPGSEKPVTIPQLFINQVKASGSRNAIFIERDSKVVNWSWDQYFSDVMKFAKACNKL